MVNLKCLCRQTVSLHLLLDVSSRCLNCNSLGIDTVSFSVNEPLVIVWKLFFLKLPCNFNSQQQGKQSATSAAQKQASLAGSKSFTARGRQEEPMDDFDLEFDNDDDLGGDDDLSQKNGDIYSDDDEIPESQNSDGFATDDATGTISC